MSPGTAPVPAWRQTLEQHATWQHWTAALRVDWAPDGLTLRDVPTQWGPEIQAPDFAVQDAVMPPPRMRLWRLVRYALPRYRVSLVETGDLSVLQLRIREK